MWRFGNTVIANSVLKHARHRVVARISPGSVSKPATTLNEQRLYPKETITTVPVQNKAYPKSKHPHRIPTAVTHKLEETKTENSVTSNSFVRLLHAKEYDDLLKYYRSNRAEVVEVSDKLPLFKALFSACTVQTDVSTILDMIDDVRSFKLTLGVGDWPYRALVRCYIEGNNVSTAIVVVKDMIDNLYYPDNEMLMSMLKSALQKDDKRSIKTILNIMCDIKTPIRADNVRLLFEVFNFTDDHFVKQCASQISHLFKEFSQVLFGLPGKELRNIVSGARQMTLDAVEQDGILVDCVESLMEIPANIDYFGSIDEESIKPQIFKGEATIYEGIDGTIPRFARNPILTQNNKPFLPLGSHPNQFHKTSIKMDTKIENYFLLPQSTNVDVSTVTYTGKRARLVNIPENGCCPNCKLVLPLRLVNDVAKLYARSVLSGREWEISSDNKLYLADFSLWLQDQDEFDIIIDAKDIAFKNNLDFLSFNSSDAEARQLETQKLIEAFDELEKVINILKRDNLKCKILVLAPHIPRLDKPVLSTLLETTIRRVSNRSSVYMVPEGVNYDFYWMYASLHEHRKNRGLVVTNNTMSDLSDVFDPRSMLYWKTSQQIQHEPFMGGYMLHWPASYTRDFQHSANGKWHIPSMSGTEWLCLQL